MKIKCIRKKPTDSQIIKLGRTYNNNQIFDITVGNIYTVLSVQYMYESTFFGTGIIVQIKDDQQHLSFAPICLFAIVDNRVSKYWEVFDRGDGEIQLCPPSFNQKYYHDDLSEGIPEIVEDFERVCSLLDAEYE